MKLAIAAAMLPVAALGATGEHHRNGAIKSLEVSAKNLKALQGKPSLKKRRKQMNKFASNMVLKSKSVYRECDPSSAAADIGLLSCGPDILCVENAESKLGGFCAQESFLTGNAARRLEIDVCDPTYELYEGTTCDCSALDYASGTGTLICTQEPYDFPFCDGLSIGYFSQQSFVDGTETIYKSCYTVETPVAQSFCTEINYVDGTCAIEFDGVACDSCVFTYGDTNYYDIDCTNAGGVAGNFSEEAIGTSLLPVVEECLADCEDTTCSDGSDPNAFATFIFDGTETDCFDFAFAFICGETGLSCPEFNEVSTANCCGGAASDSGAPTASPVDAESAAPTASPVDAESAAPTASPVDAESAAPTASPVDGESAAPTTSPVDTESAAPSASPVADESAAPSAAPEAEESASPTDTSGSMMTSVATALVASGLSLAMSLWMN